MSNLQLSVDEQGHLLLNASFSESATAIKIEQVAQLFADSEFNNFFYDEEKAKDAVSIINDKVAQSKTAEPIVEIIGERRNTKVKVNIATDKMSAQVEVTAPYGGKCLTPKQIIRCLSQMQVTMGVDQEKVKALSLAIESAEPGQQLTEVLAYGKEPKNGQDSTFESFTESARDRILKPQETDHGKVDMRDLGELISVKQGAKLMQRHPPTLGKPGYTVDGEPLQPVPGQEIQFEVGEGTEVSKDDKDLLIASMAGLPYVLEAGMRVDNVLMLNGVDVASGHINFEGGVVVNGDVSEGMKLRATGDVTVTGVIDNALVDVQGDLTVAGGIVGRKVDESEGSSSDGYECHINARGTVAAKYIQYTDINAGEDVIVQSQLMHSHVHAKRIYGTDIGNPNGKIVGGYLTVEECLACAIIGAPASTHTYIELFPTYQEKKEKLIQADKLLDEKMQRQTEVKLKWQALSKQKPSDKQAKLMQTIKAEYKKLQQLIKRLELAKTKLTTELEAGLSKSYVKALRDVYANTHVTLGKMKSNTERDYPGLMINTKDDELVKLTL